MDGPKAEMHYRNFPFREEEIVMQIEQKESLLARARALTHTAASALSVHTHSVLS